MIIDFDRKGLVSKDLVRSIGIFVKAHGYFIGMFGMFVQAHGNFLGSFGNLVEAFENCEVEFGPLSGKLDI